MAQRKSRGGASRAPDNDMAKAMSDSAQKIWLAGLGAFERAKTEGPKMFETLAEQGRGLTEKAREAADQALRAVRESAGAAGGRFDKLEQVFEDRVSKSLNRLGVLTRGEVSDLSRQVRELTDDVRRMMEQSRGGAAARGAAKGSVKRKATKAKRKATKAKRKAKAAAKR
jgi:poly(hydroxyalkanoate) granule-associated protein